MNRSSTAKPATDQVLGLLFSRLPAGRALNVGAGLSGYVAPGLDVVNIDHIPPLSAADATFVVADVNRMPFKPGSFDGAVMKDILEHVPDAIALLKEVRRVVRRDARVVVVTPRAIPRAVWADPTHVRGFTARALVDAASLGGWRVARAPRRMGALPGAARLGLIPWLEHIMRIPGVGHWFGTNWLLEAVAV